MADQLSQKYSVTQDYISASVNRFSRAADVSHDSTVAYGSSSLIAIWSVSEDENTGVEQTLAGHEGRVTCIRFKEGESCFLSTDDKGFLKCWTKKLDKWINTASVKAHSSPVSALGVYGDCIATGSSDGSVTVWQHVSSQEGEKEESFLEAQKLDMRGKYPLDIAITQLPESTSLILAVCATERNVSMFVRSDDKFVRAASLPGHEDWVKSLAFQHSVAGPSTLTLASGSQDNTIRLWNIEKLVKDKPISSGQEGDVLSDELLDSFEAALGDLAEGEEGGRQISMKRHVLTVGSRDGIAIQYAVTFDALLIGHEAGVTSVVWRPSPAGMASQPMLLSTSTDSSLILWSPSSIPAASGDQSTSLWINQQRFGDIGGQRLGGFVGSLWACGAKDALAWGWAGGWRRWRCQSDELGTETWQEANTVSGHNGPVHGITWSPGGEYLISTSPDQTTRIHGDINSRSDTGKESWHEIGRPQVHGYDLHDAVFLNSTRFVSIAEEKVARVFEAPRSFVLLAKQLGYLPDVVDENDRPIAASVPPLGLSNKALSNAESSEAHFPLPTTSMAERRPYEGELAVSTLWPEVEKVFGHGYELHAIASSSSGKYVATACRATSPEHAGIKVYDSETWKPFGQTLFGHQLTVTRIAFSPDDKYILSVSRDRSWRLFKHTEDGYVPLASDKSHARIIWDCAWTLEGDLFATASRDKTVGIWGPPDQNNEKQAPVKSIKLKEAATAVSFTSLDGGRRLLAIGVETGHVFVYVSDIGTPQTWSRVLHLDEKVGHIDHIHRLQWRPVPSNNVPSNKRQLATCSEDGTIRILSITV